MTTSLSGFSDQLRNCAVGETISRAARVPIAERDLLKGFRTAGTAAVAKVGGDFTMQTLDGISDGYTHCVRVLVVTRLS